MPQRARPRYSDRVAGDPPPSVWLVERDAFFAYAAREPEFIREIERGTCFVVRGYLPPAGLAAVRDTMGALRAAGPAQWHPCLDGCPDHHRINDEYPGSHVRGRLRVYHLHPWNPHRQVFELFADVFDLKHRLAGVAPGAYLANRPSDQVIARVTINHYPRGGGWLHEHVDPAAPFARIQTLVMGSQPGSDYTSGGFFYRLPDGRTVTTDAWTAPGDLVVLSPHLPHGVSPVDPEHPLDWERPDGRLSIIPIVMYSDDPKVQAPRSYMPPR